MKMLDMVEFQMMAGIRAPSRDMSAYSGKSFQCACGDDHLFSPFMDYRNFATTGANAKMMVTCPNNPSVATIIQTKYKFLVVFDRFVSLAGHKS